MNGQEGAGGTARPMPSGMAGVLPGGGHDDVDGVTGADLRQSAADATDGEAWLRQATALESQGLLVDALDATHRALSSWPDVTPVHELQLRLAQRLGNGNLALQALRHLLVERPDDPMLNSEMGARLSERGEFDRAIPFLRIAAPILLHDNCSIWNYTTALAVTGQHDELLAAQPLLDRMASHDPSASYPPFCHLAAARLSRGFSRDGTVGAMEVLQASVDWLDVPAIHARIQQAILRQESFSLVRLDHPLARFICVTSLRVNLTLRPEELSAVAASVWSDWFDGSVEDAGASRLARISRLMLAAIKDADITGLPDADVLRHDQTNFGFLAEMQRLVLGGEGRAYGSFHFAESLHRMTPFLRPVLQGLPFLGVIGPYPELARKLGRFYGIGELRSLLPDRLPPSEPGGTGGAMLDEMERALDTLTVPFKGAVFLVVLGGPYGILFCGRIKSLGGIALDLGAVASSWDR